MLQLHVLVLLKISAKKKKKENRFSIENLATFAFNQEITFEIASCSFLFRSSISSNERGTRFLVVLVSPLFAAAAVVVVASLPVVSPSSISSSFDFFVLLVSSFLRRFILEKKEINITNKMIN